MYFGRSKFYLMESYNYKISFLSDSALIVTFEPAIIDAQLNEYIIYIGKQLEENPMDGQLEVVVAYNSITIYINVLEILERKNNLTTFFQNFEKKIDSFLQSVFYMPTNATIRLKEISVHYDGEDLAFLAEYHRLTEKEIVAIHTAPIYRVYMMGFLPGFAYMGGLDKRIATPRKKVPRRNVPAGSVGIAGNQTGIYPLESPGGWQLIGRTEIALFNPSSESLTYLQQGDLVKFIAV